MRHDLNEIGQRLHRQPLGPNDFALLREHARRRAEGPGIARQLKQREHVIVARAVRRLYEKYPEKLTQYASCEEKTRRDMKLVLRYCLYSILLDDPDYAKERMFYWFRTILNAFAFGKTFIEDAYRLAQEEIRAELDPAAAKKLNAMVDEAIEVFNS